MAHVILRDITKRFGSVVAVDKLNLEIARGECISFLGPSGCGKTTTLRMLAGFEDLDEGEILVGDRVISSSFKNYYLPPEKRDFGMVFQAFAVWPHLSVFDNVAFPLQIRGLSRSEIREKTTTALTYTGLLDAKDELPERSCRAARSSGSRWPAPSRSIRRSCSWTSRSRTSTRRCAR